MIFPELWPLDRIPVFRRLRRHLPDLVRNLELVLVPGCRRGCSPRVHPPIPETQLGRELILGTSVFHLQIWESRQAFRPLHSQLLPVNFHH